jgi:anti-sigma-K factor RskA
MNTIDKEPERHEIEVLLPWYAAGTLSRCDADLVERALARDSELARRYDLVRQELAETIQLNEALGAPRLRDFCCWRSFTKPTTSIRERPASSIHGALP